MASQPPIQVQDPFATPAEPESEFHISRWIEVVKRRRHLIYIATGVAVAIGVLLYLITPKAFRSTATIQIERRAPGPVKVDDVVGFETYWDAQSFYPTQFKLLESRGLAERVVTSLRLYDDPVFNPGRASLGGTGSSAASNTADRALVARLASRVRGGLTVEPVRNTRLVQISYVAPTADLAARVANGVAETYIDWGMEIRGATIGRASSFLSQQIEALKEEISDKEAQLQAYSRRTDIVALDPSSNVTLQRLEGLNRDYTSAVSERISREAQYQSLLHSPKEAIADTLSGGVVAQLRSEILRLERDYASKLSTYKPEWPAMQDLKAQIDQGNENMRAVINETVSKARDAARVEYETALRREQALAAEMARQKGEAMQLNSAAVEYNNLKVEVSTRRTLLDELVRKQSQTDVAGRLQGSRESNVIVVDQALVPGGPYRPSLQRNLMLAAVLGFGIGLGLIFVAEYLDRTIKTTEDVERVLGLPVLGVVPDQTSPASRSSYIDYTRLIRRKQPAAAKDKAVEEQPPIELICASHPRLAASEAYRSLRTALLLSTAADLRTVLVTSANVGEGKTVTASNLAVVLAQLGRHVLLIDADLRKPRQHEVFKVSNRTGVVNYLTGQAEIAQVFTRTSVANLQLASSGPIPPNPAELLSSDRMRELIALANQRFDFVIIDSPPVLPVTDATIMSALVDGVVLCLGAGRLERDEARACLDRLQMVDAKVLGVVLNRFTQVSGRYRHGYYQEYQTYVDQAADPASRARAAG